MKDKRIDLFGIFKEEDKLTKVFVYSAVSNESDPYTHEKSEALLNPIIVKALVRQISPEAVVWKYWGTINQDSLEIIAELKHYDTFRSAKKIIINDLEYKTLFNDNKGFGILKRSDFLVCVVVRKNG